MIKFKTFQLDNGLTVVLSPQSNTKKVVVNLMYNVGSKHEEETKTGLAHLLEHLMFGGTNNIPSFDGELQKAGGYSNAYTSNDVTNYYSILPSQNLEIALWLESDRMQNSHFGQKTVDIQKKVVIEEFKETQLNKPYGKLWAEICKLCYKIHPYKWPVIGKSIEQIEKFTRKDVLDFFARHYMPSNCVMTIVGDIEIDKTKKLVEKWFSKIPDRDLPNHIIPQEPQQKDTREKKVQDSKISLDAHYKCFRGPKRNSNEYYILDLVTNILALGKSSWLHRELVIEKKIFTTMSAYQTSSIDDGLIILGGKINNDKTIDQAEKALEESLKKFIDSKIDDKKILKAKNQTISDIHYSYLDSANIAQELALYFTLGEPNLINDEISMIENITIDDFRKSIQKIFIPQNESKVTLYK